ncbi:hypothetical protein JJB07_14610 [Tumebacillus sp. ITR2]|uniref:Uncharacterized protein n=1 Tax=Tumebacillus amylolyticus TaxID=2801339 RepID=A0ABS1JCA3_9BACL|nr:hypothetical protein [Tumebacillus amylolyticus]MBL0387870.1 hypothetical protein [Tumebacillus amylolyticus]
MLQPNKPQAHDLVLREDHDAFERALECITQAGALAQTRVKNFLADGDVGEIEDITNTLTRTFGVQVRAVLGMIEKARAVRSGVPFEAVPREVSKYPHVALAECVLPEDYPSAMKLYNTMLDGSAEFHARLRIWDLENAQPLAHQLSDAVDDLFRMQRERSAFDRGVRQERDRTAGASSEVALVEGATA